MAICVMDAVPDAIFAVTQMAAGAAQWISISYRVRTIPNKAPNPQYPIILAYPNANTNTGA